MQLVQNSFNLFAVVDEQQSFARNLRRKQLVQCKGVNINFFNGDKWTLVLGRYIDREGKVALETEYAPLGNFMGDVAFVQTRDGVALMNRKGELVGETRFRSRFNSLIQRLYSSGISLVDYLNF